ncbi:trace amine-associated receptor 13c-like [Lepisosteus oculatus]|uniref:trace amine-associated receptor 13c-like n=1 Tax=Lepisosteus oculatus TaxID=7918 RepID=UPI0035F511A6
MDLNEIGGHQIVQYCFASDNTSCTKETRSTAVYVILYVFFISVVMLTVCGNLVVIISISHFKQLHTPTNLLLLSLAVADFLIGLIVMPLAMIRYIETCWYFGRIFCMMFYLVLGILTFVSLINVVFISIDRYFAVCDPLQYYNKITVNVIHAHVIKTVTEQLTYRNGSNTKVSKRSEIKAAKTLGTVVAVFLLCFLPYYIGSLVQGDLSVSSSVTNSLIFVINTSSAMNPIIYALFYPWFQKSVKEILKFRVCDRASNLINLFPENQ